MSAPLRPALILDKLILGYGGKAVVDPIDGTVSDGALLALVGPNGAGKSTLLKALAGLLRPMSGSISSLDERRVSAYMPQQSEIDRSFPMDVIDFVAMGMWNEIGWWRPITQQRRATARAALARVGIAGAERARIGALSGGQLRRALFARALLQDARLILLDEPFAGIDTATAADLMRIIHGWHAEGRTVIAALHDLDQVRTHFPTALLLARKVIGWGDPAVVLTNVNLATAQTLCASSDIGESQAAIASKPRNDV